jgi:hypothetical protein
MWQSFKKPMLALLLTYFAIIGLMFFFQKKLQYHPSGKIQPVSFYSLNNFEEKTLTTKDGIKILAWYKKPEDKKTILYFHGNAGNMGERAHKFEAFARAGFGVLAISYRGYPSSEGTPSEAGFMNDAFAALQFLFDQGFKSQDIILFGESLGSGVAVELAVKSDFAAVVLESPFSSAVSVGQRRYWFAPVFLLLKDKFESIKLAPKIPSPVLILHGTKDEVVPYDEGQKLFAAIRSEKKFVTIDGAGHLNFGDQFLVSEMEKFLDETKN